MFDCAYQPEPEPKPAALPSTRAQANLWLVATLLVTAVGIAAVLGSLAADYVMS